ncbi:MAG TPA: FKBP-type peptidyl-prolyl cis-trans isomerase [Granulicella sp.]
MRFTSALAFAALAPSLAFGQTAAKKPAAPAAPPTAATYAVTDPGCSTLPTLSPQIPALPAGLPCAKPLYTITTTPPISISYLSPVANPALREFLGAESSTFSLSYIDVQAGTGAPVVPHKFLTLNYTGYLVDGTKFDSSFDHDKPITLPYGDHKVILGWDTGLDGMRVGGKRRLFIPYQLAYGAGGRLPTIPEKAELIFDVELLSVSDTEPAPKPETPAATPSSTTEHPQGH